MTKLDWNGQNLYTYGVTSGMEIDFTGMEIFTNLKQVTIEQLFKGESITANIGIVKIRIYSLCFRMLKN